MNDQSLITNLRVQLDAQQAAHLYRQRRIQNAPAQPRGNSDGQPVLSFCSNDYLGLANHPAVIAALQRGAERWGVGSGAAHLVNGHTAAHHALEEELAEFTGQPRTLLFSTGYMANLGVITALIGRGETIVQDRLNHASLLDGAQLSRATLRRYAHGNINELNDLIAKHHPHCIVTDGVFSMDGDLAPLPALTQIARAAGAWLLIDDAHGFGVLGRGGRGSLNHFELSANETTIVMGTLGKAFGTFGAFVAGAEAVIETLIQRARSYIFTTAMPPALAEATRVSLLLAESDDWRREQLRALIARFRHGATQLDLPLADSFTPIQPLLTGSAARALTWSAALETAGILVTAIRPPTVPVGTARLRITLSAAHTEAEVDRLLATLIATQPAPD
ncbi:8-amino-7-oxononanoate synthase [Chromatium weissei]|nr:8-amino-7-oxononanoate synthase [Chromatium weissei]